MQYIDQFNDMALASAGRAFVICLHRLISNANGMPHGWLCSSPWSGRPDSRRLRRSRSISDLTHRVGHRMVVMLMVVDTSDTRERIKLGNTSSHKEDNTHGWMQGVQRQSVIRWVAINGVDATLVTEIENMLRWRSS